jgi:mRNA interferase MazF
MTTSCKPGDVVVVPFPFVDIAKAKPRPALVLSAQSFNREGLVVLAMITTAKATQHPRDLPIRDLDSAGLPIPSFIRWKIFTLDTAIIRKQLGALSKEDRKRCRKMFRKLFPPFE